MNSKKASELLDISVDTMRYYERVGVVPPVPRDDNGYRNYGTSELNWLFMAKSLKTAGLSVEAMIEFAQLAQSNGDVKAAQKDILQEQLDLLEEKFEALNKTKNLLQYKIDTYDDHLAKFRTGEMTPENVDKLWENRKFSLNHGHKK